MNTNNALQGKRIMLRAVEPEDASVLQRWENDTEGWIFSNNFLPYSLETMHRFASSPPDLIRDKQVRFMISIPEHGSSIGCIDLFDYDPFHQRAGIGILIESSFRKKGFAAEALDIFCQYSFNTLCLNQLHCTIPINNEGSLRLFRKLGFQECGTRKSWIRTNNGFLDELMLQKLNPSGL